MNKSRNLTGKNVFIVLLFFVFSFLSPGCATTKHAYVSDQHPYGNKKLSMADYSECSNKVPADVKKAGAQRSMAYTPMYIAGTPGIYSGAYVNSYSVVCDSKCAKANALARQITSKCMKEKGWEWKILKDKTK